MTDAMTSRERSDLLQLARMKCRVMKADVEAVVADRVLVFEEEFQREWSAQELQVDDLVAAVTQQIAAINAEMTRRCDELGIRPELRPKMLGGFAGRQYLSKQGEGEMRRLARVKLDAAGKRAKAEIDRQTVALCGEIISTGISSAEARELLGKVQTAEQLVPPLKVHELEIRAGGSR